MKKPRLKGGDYKGSDLGKHTRNPGYRPGDNWLVCDVCGFHYYSSDCRERWDEMVVCKKCWEPRHEQDFVRARNDKIVPDGLVRPEGDDIFVPSPEYNPDGGGGIYPPKPPSSGNVVGLCFTTPPQ